MRILFSLVFAFTIPLGVPGLTTANRSAAEYHLQQGQADAALRILQPAAVPGSQDAEAHQLLCRLSLELEHWDDAVAACERAVALDDSSSMNHLWYGRALGEKADRVSFIRAYGLGKRVKVEFERSVALDPRNAEALSDLGEYYTEAPPIVGGGKDKAAAVAGRLDSVDRARAEELRGRIAVSNNDTAAAEQHFRRAISVAREPANYWMVLGSFYQRQQNIDQMLRAISDGLAAPGASGTPLVDASHMLVRSHQDPQLAIRLLRDYLASPRKSEEEPAFRVQLFLAQLLDAQGDAADAAREIQAASSIASIYHPSKPVATNTGR